MTVVPPENQVETVPIMSRYCQQKDGHVVITVIADEEVDVMAIIQISLGQIMPVI